MIVNNIGSAWNILAKVFYVFVEKEKSQYYGNPVIADISINNYIQYLTNRTNQQIINVCYNKKVSIKINLFVCLYTEQTYNGTNNYMQ